MNKLDQAYLDLCTSWQSEPKYKEDVMMILQSLSKQTKKGKIDPEKFVEVRVPVPQEYRISACFNVLFNGKMVFRTRVGAVREMIESLREL